jgi:ABC-type Fe3+-hydroxamate transport system substrate-binding protein
MANDETDQDGQTRRAYLKYGGVLATAGMAGCVGGGDSGSGDSETPTATPDEETPAETPTATPEETPTETESTPTATPEDTSYSVTMSPMGTVEFDSVPEAVVSFDDQWVDHLVALGQADKLAGLARPDGYFTAFYERLPDVSFDTEGVEAIWAGDAVDSELFFELDADVHHIDPFRAQDLPGLDEQNIETIESEIGPFFANRGSRAHNIPGGRDIDYEFYSLWEILSKFAEVYQVQDRSQALRTVRDEMVSEIQSNLPPEGERPTVALAQFWEGEFYVYDPNKAGFGSAHTRPVQLTDALPDVSGYAASNWQEGVVDVETMLEANPDVFIYHNAVGIPENFRSERSNMHDEEVVSQITAVQNDRIYPGGLGLGGPLFNLFQIEMTAKQVYPERFGEYPGLREPVPEDEQLFDRQRVADIVNGNL